MHVNIYNKLPKEAREIRETVFIKEQGFCDEFDEIDTCAKHFVLFDREIPIATCRFYNRESFEDYYIGRIAVMKQYRGQGIGAYLLRLAEAEVKRVGGKRTFLHAQQRAKGFYEKQGYISYGETDLEENCPHIWMYKDLLAKRNNGLDSSSPTGIGMRI